MTAKQLALRTLNRTTDYLKEHFDRVPPERLDDSPGGSAPSLRWVIQHLIDCEGWWLVNFGAEPPKPPFAAREPEDADAAALWAVFAEARQHVLGVLEGLDDEFFETHPESAHYDPTWTGAELCFYIGEHDFHHAGEMAMLEQVWEEREVG
ncbi:MAG: DUF664 domain-containing protein [Armatimonadia bacterium]|nr:DUF664 domain-containing protein [Armatimonadia bacterium]